MSGWDWSDTDVDPVDLDEWRARMGEAFEWTSPLTIIDDPPPESRVWWDDVEFDTGPDQRVSTFHLTFLVVIVGMLIVASLAAVLFQ